MKNIFYYIFLIQSFFYLCDTIMIKKNIIKDACKNIIFYNNNDNHNKKLISLSPGGYKGIYMLGTSIYIKEQYNLSDCIFSGASAGAWNALFLCCNKNIDLFLKILVSTAIERSNNIFDFEKKLKNELLENLDSDDFDFNRLYIGVTALSWFSPKTIIYSNFCNLEDAIDCCMASSHIPFLTGNMLNKYKNFYSFDGGFSKYPYIESSKSILHISPSIWKKKISSFANANFGFSKQNINFEKMLLEGYDDALQNKAYLDTLLL